MKHLGTVLTIVVAVSAGPGLRGDFVRGDANQDHGVDISDAVFLLAYLFESNGLLRCEDAADASDDGRVDLTDPIAVLNALFSGAVLPSPGTAAPGPDPTCDSLGCEASPELTPPVVISEIDYNPDGSALLEFVELHNRTDVDIDLGMARFTNGIDLTIPPDTIIPAGGFLLVVKDIELRTWRNVESKVGSYEGWLDDGGERLTFRTECGEETVRFDDRSPWPLGPDGYLRTLERVDYLAPADDFHSWRASEEARGTPGEPNSSFGIPTRPVIRSATVSPAAPTSGDAVTVVVVIDAGPRTVEAATLHWETLAMASPVVEEGIEMTVAASGDDWMRYEATVPPRPSQTLVRMNVELRLAPGLLPLDPDPADPGREPTLVLPHAANPDACISYFVYDREVETTLPLLWLFPRRNSLLPLGPVQRSAAVAFELGADAPRVFDGALLDPRRRSAGLNLKFLKGREFRGDRTVNILPEQGNGGSGTMAPHMEYLGFDVWRELGGLAPRADFYRVIESANTSRPHSQRLVVQQVNERFLEMNGFDSDGDLYKLDHKLGGWAKRTNLHTGRTSLSELLAAVTRGTEEERREQIHAVLDVDNVRRYSVHSMLIGNWDGFHNNLFAYQDPSPDGKWILIPWDLDQVFETDLWNFVLDFPITSRNPGSSRVNRSPGPISRPFHSIAAFHQAYLDDMKALLEDGSFGVESVGARIDLVERRLLEDVDLLGALLGSELNSHRARIQNAYRTMRTYVERRVEYLRGVLE